MATLVIVSNGTSLYPELPIAREDIIVADDQRMLNGQLRRAYRAVKKRIAYGQRDSTEAERTTWLAAHPLNVSYTHTDELGVTRTVITTRRIDTLSRTAPASAGTPAFYDLEIEVEEV